MTHTASCGCLSCRRTESPHRLQAPLRPAAGRRTGHLRDRLDAVRRSAGPARSANVWPRCVRSPASPTASKSIAYVSPQVVLELGTHAEFIPQDRFAIRSFAAEEFPKVVTELTPPSPRIWSRSSALLHRHTGIRTRSVMTRNSSPSCATGGLSFRPNREGSSHFHRNRVRLPLVTAMLGLPLVRMGATRQWIARCPVCSQRCSQ